MSIHKVILYFSFVMVTVFISSVALIFLTSLNSYMNIIEVENSYCHQFRSTVLSDLPVSCYRYYNIR